MAEIRPWYRWHINRWKKSPNVLAMSLAAHGAYRNLLDAAWENGAKLPNTPEVFWRYALASSREEFAAVAEQVIAMFTVSDDGKWLTNETLTEEWNDASLWFKKKSDAGTKGSEARWKKQEPLTVNDTAMTVPSQSHSDAIAEESECLWQNMAPHLTSHNQTKDLKPSASKAKSRGINNSAFAKMSGETRHTRVQQMVMNWYLDWAGTECPWDGGEGKQLSALLKSTPNWPDAQFVTCLDNLAKSSKCIPRGDRPASWLHKLPKFLHGPLAEFFRPESGGTNGNGQYPTTAEKRHYANANAATEAAIRKLGANQGNGRDSDGNRDSVRNGVHSGTGPVVDGMSGRLDPDSDS